MPTPSRSLAARMAAVALVAAFGVSAHAQAPGAASGAFAAAAARFEEGDYRAALELFEAARDAGADEPAIHFNIGVCQYRLGEHERAAATFRMLGERFPELRALADYNLGLAELGAGRNGAAEAAFARAAESTDPTIAELAARMLGRTAEPAAQAAAGDSRWTRYLELQAGHDDNVALLEDSSLPAGLSSASPFAEVLAVVSGEPFAAAPLALDLSGYFVRYPDASAYDQDALRIGARYLAGIGAWHVEVGPHYDRSNLDGDGFEEQLGASVSFRRPLEDGLELELRLQHDRFDELEREFEYVSGTRQRVRLGLRRNTAQGRTFARYELELNDRQGPSVSADRHRLAFDYERYLARDWSVELGVAYRTSEYELRPRDEDLLEANLAALKLLSAGWLVRTELNWSDNDATVAPFDYQRARLGVGIAKLF